MTGAMRIDNNITNNIPVTVNLDSIQVGAWLSFFILPGIFYYG
jgi:hypothetical protein